MNRDVLNRLQRYTKKKIIFFFFFGESFYSIQNIYSEELAEHMHLSSVTLCTFRTVSNEGP